MQPSTVRALVRFCLAAAMVSVVNACSKTDSGKSADSGKRTAGASAPGGVGAAEPGALPKPIDQMTGDELYAFTRTLSFGGGHERVRRCRGRAGCRGPRPTDSTLVRVDAVEREDSLSIGQLVANGIIGARALNKGTMADSVYNTRPGADYEYYLILAPTGPGVATWRLEELTTTPGARSHRAASSGTFHQCGHPFVRGARADFKSCATAAQATPAAFGKALFQGINEDPIWIGCAAGCCTADPGDSRG